MRRFFVFLSVICLAVTLALSACRDSVADEAAVTSAATTTAATTLAAPTTTSTTTTTAVSATTATSSTTESGIITGFVTFDGKDCTFSGPSEVPPGDYAFVLTNVSDVGAVLFARELIDGHTYQDALDQMDEAGGPGSYWPRPSWAADVTRDPDPPEIDLASGQRLLALSLEPGTYNLGVYTATSPEGIWLCAPLDVLES